MSKDRSAEEQEALADFQHSLSEMEAAAAAVDAGRELFKKVEPTHPHPDVQRRYRLFNGSGL